MVIKIINSYSAVKKYAWLTLVFAFIMFLIQIPQTVDALVQSDSDAIFNNFPNWVGNSGLCAVGGNSGGGSSSGVVWPFATKSTSQYQRVDQGWDIQTTAGGAVYAIAPGTIHVFAPDPGNFGNDYPTEQLDSSIGGPSDWVYYGHVHVLPAVVGQHVTAGQQIAVTNTTDGQNGSGAPPGWLEIGFARPGTDAPVQSGSGETVAGQNMKNLLLNAPVGQTTGPPSSVGNSCACLSGSVGGGSTGTPSQNQIANAQIIIGIAKTDNLGQAAALIGLMVGLDESGLLVLANTNVPISETFPGKQGDGSDHDSVGVFQQRPSTGWSTIASGDAADSNQAAVFQIMNPAYSAEAFFGSAPGSNAPSALSKGLQNVNGWQSMAPWVAAQTVQGSGTASGVNYQKEMPAAQALLTQYWASASPVALPISLTPGAPSGGCGNAPPAAFNMQSKRVTELGLVDRANVYLDDRRNGAIV